MHAHGRSQPTGNWRGHAVHAKFPATRFVGTTNRGELLSAFALEMNCKLVCPGTHFKCEFRSQVVKPEILELFLTYRGSSVARDARVGCPELVRCRRDVHL